MTGKEIDKVKSTDNYRTDEQLRKEIFCREMINSIMIYDGINAVYEKDGKLNKYLQKYANKWQDFYYIGEERVRELIKEQQEDFKKAVVQVGVYTDYEGCTYNTCVWADE